MCDKSFSHKHLMERHILSIHEAIHNGKGSFKCSLCEVTFTTEFCLKRHYTAAHEGKSPFKCTQEVQEIKKPFDCEICNKIFSRNAHLRSHVETVHEKKRPYKCPDCE